MDWLILLLLVPAILVPVVLLLGFTGCSFSGRLSSTPSVPGNLSAVGTSASAIRLVWTYILTELTSEIEFEIERLTAGETEPHKIRTPSLNTAWVDTDGLETGTAYFYRVRAIRTSEEEYSELSEAAIGYTFGETFCAVPGEPCGALPTPQAGLEGFCIVQRIEPARLSRSGARVILTLRGGAASLMLDRIYMSRVTTAGGNPYDSGADLTLVAASVVVPANTAVTLPVIDYALDRTRPLLIAFDISATAGQGNVRYLNPVPAGEAIMYFRPATAEAANADRLPSAANPTATPYLVSNSIYLVEKIEVATA